MSRGRLMLLSQRAAAQWGLPPAGEPFDHLRPEVAQAWREIVQAMPIPPLRSDEFWLELTARCVVRIRSGVRDRSEVRFALRCLGHGFVPMRERRRLLFP